MASHRKPRTRILQSAASKRGAIGVTTAAFASVTLLSQSASAAPDDGGARPSVESVKKKVDRLYQQAGVSTQKYNAAKEQTAAQRSKVDSMLGQVAQRTEKLNDARRLLGSIAAAQYRTGGMSDTATLLLTENPQSFFKQKHMMDRMTGRQKEAVADFEKQQRSASAKRSEATRQLESLTSAQDELRDSKREVQGKLSEARTMLSKLTAQEKARLAALERRKEAEAQRKAAARAEQERRQAAEEERQREEGSGSGSGSDSGGATGGGTADGAYATKAAKVLAFAKGQLGKPYVWGATGPSSYDCSGLTQDAWKAAGISLPRTTWDQVKVGTKVSKSQLQPGDLVFFYDDISHVGIYSGGGKMIHAPKPGANVRFESIDYMPFHSAVRPG